MNIEDHGEIIFKKRSFLVTGMTLFYLLLMIVSIPLWVIFIIGGYFSIREGNIAGGLFSLAMGSTVSVSTTYVFWLFYKYFTLRKFPLMVVANDGLHFFALSKWVSVPWNEVVNARIQLRKGMTTIRIKPKFPKKYMGRFQAWAAPEFMISTFALEGSAEDLLRVILGHRSYVGEEPQQ